MEKERRRKGRDPDKKTNQRHTLVREGAIERSSNTELMDSLLLVHSRKDNCCKHEKRVRDKEF